jgi:hypothetical protein
VQEPSPPRLIRFPVGPAEAAARRSRAPLGMDIGQDFQPITEAEQQRLLAGAVGGQSYFPSRDRLVV